MNKQSKSKPAGWSYSRQGYAQEIYEELSQKIAGAQFEIMTICRLVVSALGHHKDLANKPVKGRVPSQAYQNGAPEEYLVKTDPNDSLINQRELFNKKWYLTKSVTTESDECNDDKIRMLSRTPNDLRKDQTKNKNQLTERNTRSAETSTISQHQDSYKDDEIHIVGMWNGFIYFR